MATFQMRVDDYTSANRIDVYCDGYMLRFGLADTLSSDIFQIKTDDGLATELAYLYAAIDAPTYHYLGYDTNRTTEILERSPSRVKIRVVGNYDATSGASSSYLTNSVSCTYTFTIYSDRYTVDWVWEVNGAITIDVGLPIALYGNTANLTSENSIYENSGSESDCSDATDYNSADYLGWTADEVNAIFITLYDSDGIINQRNVADGQIYSRITYDPTGADTFTASFMFIIDSADRVGGKQYDSSALRLALGDEYKDYTIDALTTGSKVQDLRLPVLMSREPDLFDANKGDFTEASLLGSEELSNTEFTTDTSSWGAFNNATLTRRDFTSSPDIDPTGGADDYGLEVLCTGTDSAGARQTITVTANKLHKMTVRAYAPSANTQSNAARIRLWHGDYTAGSVNYPKNSVDAEDEWQTLTGYITSKSTSIIVGLEVIGSNNGDIGYFDIVSCKPIDISWDVQGENIMKIDSDSLWCFYIDNAAGLKLFLKDAADLSSDLTPGVLYILTGQAKVGSGDSVDIVLSSKSSGSSLATITSTTLVSFELRLIADDADECYIEMANMGSGEQIWLDDLVLKEASPFASDGAWHVTHAANIVKWTWDRIRYKPPAEIHDWPIMSGSTPDVHLIGHWRCNDNEANTDVDEEVQDSNWNSSSSTNTSNLSVSGVKGNAFELVRASSEYIEAGAYDITNWQNKFTVLFKFKPTHAYDTANHQGYITVHRNSTNAVILTYDQANDIIQARFRLNSVTVDISTPAFTSNNDLQQWHTAILCVDLSRDFVAFIFDGKVIGTGVQTETWALDATAFRFGYERIGTTYADVIIDEVKLFDDCIIPYGAIATQYDAVGQYYPALQEDETSYVSMRGSFVDGQAWFDGEILGSELVTNTNFDGDSDNDSPAANWTNQGNHTGTVQDDDAAPPSGANVYEIVATGGGGSSNRVYALGTAGEAGKLYKVEFYAKKISGADTQIRVRRGGVVADAITITTSWVKYTLYITAINTESWTQFYTASAAMTFRLDSVSAKEVTSLATQYAGLGYHLECRDGENKQAIGYIGEAGTGETLGSDLFDANKGTFTEASLLGSEAITAQNDRDFNTDIGNWVVSKNGVGTLTWDETDLDGADDKQGLLTSDGDTYLTAQLAAGNVNNVANTFYKLTVKIYIPSGNTLQDISLRSTGFTLNPETVYNNVTTDTFVEYSHYYYQGADLTGVYIIGFSGNPTDGDKLYFDDISIKPVDISWVPYGTNTIEIDSDALKITCVDNPGGAYLYMLDSTDFSSDLTSGKLYKLAGRSKVGSGDSVNILFNNPVGSDGSVTITSTTFVDFEIYCVFVQNNTTISFAMNAGEEIWLDDLVLKEVTEPNANAVKIYKESSLDNEGWASIDSGIDYNADTDWDFDVRITPPLFHNDIKLYYNFEASGANATQIPSDKTVTLNGSAALVTTDPIYGSKHLDCVNANDDASIPVSSYDIIDPRHCSISCWVRLETVGANWFMGFGDNSNYRVLLGATATDWRFDYEANGVVESITGGANPTANKWYHILATASDSNNDGIITLWVNGEFIGYDTVANAWNYGTGTLYIGSNDVGGGGMDCFIDQLFITKSPYTPQIATAFGKPLWVPRFKKTDVEKQLGLGYEAVFTPDLQALITEAGDVS
jgi:hypothetical protein